MNKKSFHNIVLVLSPLIMNLLKPKLEQQTKNNSVSVNGAVDLSQVMLTVFPK